MKEILLSQNKTTVVDDEDYEYLSQWKWCAVKSGKTYYAMRNAGYKNGKQINVFMHREILHAKWFDKIDHKDHNGLNNLRNNIRKATATQNRTNTPKRNNTKSKYLGVCIRGNNYVSAEITIHGKTKYLGYFKNDEIAAAKAYDVAARKYHGEFANLNFKETNE